ncbi:unnamed protein product, partial [marine sediment metagenome]
IPRGKGFSPELNSGLNLGFFIYFPLVLGAVLLWLAFIVLGIIARRYEIVLGERTDWQFMVFAPTGILFFAVIQLFFCGFEGKMMLPKGGINYIAYGFFL